MMRFANRAIVALASVVAFTWLAPSSWAMVPPEPGSGIHSTTPAAGPEGAGLWQLIGIVLIAIAVGVVGTLIAQRMRRHGPHLVTTA